MIWNDFVVMYQKELEASQAVADFLTLIKPHLVITLFRLHQELIIYTSWTHDFDLDYKGRKLSERLKAERDF